MNGFAYRHGVLHAEAVSLDALARRYGTPCYVYSRAAITGRWRALDEALAGRDHLICYAVKANSNLAVLNLLARLGSGFDIVSGGELARVLRAGGDARKVVFSGVGKTGDEIHAALEAGIYCFNVESEAELRRIAVAAAAAGVKAPVSLRVNPNIDPQTHPYIATGLRENKFGVAFDHAAALYREAAALPAIEVVGMACHIGSQLVATQPFIDALARLRDLVRGLEAEGIALRHIDVGGGLGITYRDERPPGIQTYAAAVLEALAGTPYRLLLEPGRAIVGEAGVLLTRVEYLKREHDKGFAIVDAGMNDLIRPALYGAWHDIVPVVQREGGAAQVYDVVGPVCETGDFLGHERRLDVAAGELLAVCAAGAYGFVMSSNYNTRPRPVEIMVDGAHSYQVRARETLEDLMHGEHTLP